MAQVIVDIPDNRVAEVRDTLCIWWNYDSKKIGNETKSDFLKRMLALHVKNEFIQAKANIAQLSAHDGVVTTEQTIDIS